MIDSSKTSKPIAYRVTTCESKAVSVAWAVGHCVSTVQVLCMGWSDREGGKGWRGGGGEGGGGRDSEGREEREVSEGHGRNREVGEMGKGGGNGSVCFEKHI